MKRWIIKEYGLQNLEIQQFPATPPQEREVLVNVKAVSLNARDLLMLANSMGLDLALPFVPASDMCGVVEAVGSAVTRFMVGDRVISNFFPEWLDGQPQGTARKPSYRTLGGYFPGVLSEYVTFLEDWLCHVPNSLDDAAASTLPVAGLTAWYSLVELGISRGETLSLFQGPVVLPCLLYRSLYPMAPRWSLAHQATKSFSVRRCLGRLTASIARLRMYFKKHSNTRMGAVTITCSTS